MAETSTKPYMIRALYEWCCDNGYTPYLAVTVDEHTVVPRQHVKGGEIVLNVSPMATSRLSLGNDLVEFQARFSGVAQQISIPVGNVSAIYSRETGQGMAFEVSQPAAKQDEDAAGEAGEGPAGLPSVDESPRHERGSTVQPLRGGARRRGPRRLDLDGAGGGPQGAPAADPEARPERGPKGGLESGLESGPDADDAGSHVAHAEGGGSADAGSGGGASDIGKGGGPADVAANSRKRAARGQGSADVLAFAPSAGAAKKKEKGSETSRSRSGSKADDMPEAGDGIGEGEDPPPADGGGKGGKARLTRVK